MIILRNEGEIDLSVIKIMGVNIKEHEDSIGYFGTGLKYAIATFLREGIDFEMWRGEDKYEFFSEAKEIRGKSFDVCYMHGPFDCIELPFTTDLGKNWEVWQAYREIHSNCLDENGSVFHSEGLESFHGYTTFVIRSEIDVDGVFLDKSVDALFYSESIDIYEGESQYIYYRGIRAKNLNKPSKYTYNIKENCTLTEDRQIAYDWRVQEVITKAMSSIENKEILIDVITSKGSYEETLQPEYHCYRSPSDTLKQVVSENKDKVNSAFFGYVRKHEPVQEKTDSERLECFMKSLEEICQQYDIDIDQGDGELTLNGDLLNARD